MNLPRYDELSLTAQTAYAELFEATRAVFVERSVAHLAGTFGKKTVKGRAYWYFQYRDVNGTVRQIYVGPDEPAIQALIEQSRETPQRPLEPLARSAIALGEQGILRKHFRIVRRLSEYGFFQAGGVLIGTHAFLAQGNALGVRWREGSRTQDVDFAHAGKNISIALPARVEVDVKKAIDSLAMGFLPISALGGDSGATFLNPKEPDLRLDFLTTRDRRGDDPVHLPALNIKAQPLPFMEFLLEHPTQAALFCEEGSIIVNIPAPERYALHKLVVFGERGTRFKTKATKDLLQAAALLAYLLEHSSTAVRAAWSDLRERGPKWRKRSSEGLKALTKLAPELDLAALGK